MNNMSSCDLNYFIDVCRGLGELSLEIGSSRNLSIKGEEELIYVTPSGINFEDVSQDRFSVISNGVPEGNSKKPSSDLNSHVKIYEKRRDIRAILHTHAHPITLAAIVGRSIPVLSTMHADYFGDRIEVVPFSNHRVSGFGDDKYFKNGKVFLLEKHGGLLLFSDIDKKSIISTMRAFHEICSLYVDIVSMPSVITENISEISRIDLSSIHEYYQINYGPKDGKD